jgi:hypothetical protein
MRKYLKQSVVIGIFCPCLAYTIFAAPVVKTGWIGNSAMYHQQGDNQPFLDSMHPYAVGSGFEIDGGNIINATLVNPYGIKNKYIICSLNKGTIFTNFNSINALNQYSPNGNYTLNISTTTGNITSIIKNASGQFPSAPRVTSGNNTVWIDNYLVLINKTNPCSFSWLPPSSDVQYVSVNVNNGAFVSNLSTSTTSFTLNKTIIEQLPDNEPIYGLIQFVAKSGCCVTTDFYFYKIALDQVGLFKIVKNHAFVQTDATPPKDWGTQSSTEFFSDYGPYSFSMESIRNGFVIDPKGSKLNLAFKYPNQSVYNSGPIQTKSDLNRLFPDGTYKLGNQTATLSGSAYPNNEIPIKILFVNGKSPVWKDSKLVLNPKIKNKIQWSPFNISSGEFKSRGIIEFDIKYQNPFIHTFKEVRAGITYDDTNAFNSFTIDANELSPDRDYFISIRYFLASSVNAATQSGGGYSTSTYVWISPTGQ